MGIDCTRCDTRGVACQDCVVTVLVPRGSERFLGAEELRALRVLADAGMVPPLRLTMLGLTMPGLTAGPVPLPLESPRARTWAFPATKAS
jgi:hypothetical protein